VCGAVMHHAPVLCAQCSSAASVWHYVQHFCLTAGFLKGEMLVIEALCTFLCLHLLYADVDLSFYAWHEYVWCSLIIHRYYHYDMFAHYDLFLLLSPIWLMAAALI